MNRPPAPGVAVRVIESPWFALHTRPVQSPGWVVSAIATVPPLPAAATIALIETKDAVSVPVAAAVNEHVAP